jgi:peptidoglycan/xylan/chitin deacetylase (PgdA/CDA1 family)
VRPLVLCYHAVSDGWRHLLAVRPTDLERQLRTLLERGYRPVPIAQAVEGSGKLVHVTFDDAFASVANAVPVLERLGVRATVFVCSGYPDDGRPLDLPELETEVAEHPDDLRTATWDDLRALAAKGIEIGAHSVSHAHLCGLSDDQFAKELRESKERIEAELERPCPFLAYPYGEHDGRVRDAARAAGYAAAFAQQPKDSTWADPYRLPRVAVWRGDGDRTFRFKTSTVGRSAPVSALRRARNLIAE